MTWRMWMSTRGRRENANRIRFRRWKNTRLTMTRVARIGRLRMGVPGKWPARLTMTWATTKHLAHKGAHHARQHSHHLHHRVRAGRRLRIGLHSVHEVIGAGCLKRALPGEVPHLRRLIIKTEWRVLRPGKTQALLCCAVCHRILSRTTGVLLPMPVALTVCLISNVF